MKQIKVGKDTLQNYNKFVLGLTPEESFNNSSHLVSDYIQECVSPVGQPRWLESDIHDTQWAIKLVNASIVINFDIQFQSSTGEIEHLNSPKHKKLINVFKSWLLIQSSPLHRGSQEYGSKTISVKIRHTLYLIDFILLNSATLRLEKHFLLWDQDLVYTILARLFDKDSISIGVYDIEAKLEQYIKARIVDFSEAELEDSFKKLITTCECDECFINNITKQHRLKLGFLNLENAYDKTKKRSRSGQIKLTYLREKLLSNTLYGHRVHQPTLELYSLNNIKSNSASTEYPQHPLNKRLEIGISDKYFSEIRQNFYMLSDVNQFSNLINLDTANVNSSCFEDINLGGLLSKRAKYPGRVLTIGAGEVLPQIRNGFEFIYRYGEIILNSVESILAASKEEINLTSLMEFTDVGYKKYLSQEIIDLGVQVLGYEINDKDRFKKRRKNKDLFFLYNVLQGALQIIVGSTMARRMGELIELDPFRAITPEGINPESSPNQDFNLIFDNRKSGLAFGDDILREQLSRPILNSIATIIYKWQEFNKKLNQKGLLKKLKKIGLFSSVSHRSVAIKESNTESFVDNLNAFCDYFEMRTYVDEHGVTRRLYIRQHQLRRFFAMVFYWAYGYEASETLRYFLAHTDVEHLESYVVEETSGEVLRGVQAERLIDGIKNQDVSEVGELEVILKNKFGLNSLEYRTYKEINEDIQDEVIKLDCTHKHVIPQRYENYTSLLEALEGLLEEGVIDLKAEYAAIQDKDGNEMAIIDLVLKYE